MQSEYENLIEEFITDLFKKEWVRLVRYAKIQLRRYRLDDADLTQRAEDVVQEAFCTAYDKIEELQQKANPEAWLYGVVYYKIKDAIREEQTWRKSLTLIPPDRIEENEEPSSLDELLQKEDFYLLYRLYIEGYSSKEMAEELGISKNALNVRVHRLKKKFKKFFKK